VENSDLVLVKGTQSQYNERGSRPGSANKKDSRYGSQVNMESAGNNAPRSIREE
jgi:hypothetical protein